MRRLFLCAGLSVVLYVLVFGLLVDRPLSLGLLRLELEQKTARLAALPSPKLVILAGSNGPYSHSCMVIGAMLDLPCENAGIAVGIGLDDIFARYAPLLRRGDIVYMPMELQQYTTTQAQYAAGADGAFLLRHDRGVLAALSARRILGAVFCCTLGDLLEGVAEMPLARSVDPAALLASEYNVQGDRIDNALVDADPALLRFPPRLAPSAGEIANGYGTALIARFVSAETAQGVVVIGGLPTDFVTVAVPVDVRGAVAAVYTGHGGGFFALPNDSRYPVQDFFNGEDHLARPCQFLHSEFIGKHLALVLHRTVRPPGADVLRLAATCPSGN